MYVVQKRESQNDENEENQHDENEENQQQLHQKVLMSLCIMIHNQMNTTT